MILAGDIGGTNTRLAVFELTGELTMAYEEKYPSKAYSGLDEIVAQFLAAHPINIEVASFGIAGPVQDGRCKATNLPWEVDAHRLSKAFKIPSVGLYNDLLANANGLKLLSSKELYCLQEGKIQVGNQALIAAGTGLGEAGLIWNGKTHAPFACEGGHTDFAPRNELEIELLLFLQKLFGHVSYERLISGPGLYALYQFLAQIKREKESIEVIEAMKKQDPSTVIVEFGLANKDHLCRKVLAWFLSLYGSESGNMALKFLAVGGFYIGGGIAPRLWELFRESEFLTSFSDKGRFKELLEMIPIYLVLNDNAALLGAASFARMQVCLREI